ncbi:MAG: PKD domain-containing protein [Chitinivibrionales bacterium]|nr:PKD domain-containing protein [Chitinivibrionales bacterium]
MMMQKKMLPARGAALAAALILFVCCGKKEPGLQLQADIVVGNATVLREGKQAETLEKEALLRPGDILTIPQGAKLKLSAGLGNTFYLNAESEISIDQKLRDNGAAALVIKLVKGEIYSVVNDPKMIGGSLEIDATVGNVRCTSGQFSAAKAATRLTVNTLVGSVDIVTAGDKDYTVNACTHWMIAGVNAEPQQRHVWEDDITPLKIWIGKTTIASALSLANCGGGIDAEENATPVFTDQPQSLAKVGKPYSASVSAADPESTVVTYSLVSGPQGMTIDAQTGQIAYTPSEEGEVRVQVRATDENSKFSDMDFTITVSDEAARQLKARLKAARMAGPADPVVIDASGSRNGSLGPKGLSYRFDINGDGAWDYPKNGEFGSKGKITHTFQKEGTFNVVLQIKNGDGQTARYSRSIVINTPPKAALTIDPQFGSKIASFTLDASRSSDVKDGDALQYRWDFGGDGEWDTPDDGTFGQQNNLTHSFDDTGTHTVIVQVKDSDGSTSAARSQVEISEVLAIDTLIAGDSISVGSLHEVKCRSTMPVIEYAWDFDGDGAFDKRGADSVGAHAYEKEGSYGLTCRIRDESGQTATKTKTVVVVNAGATVDAKGPYTVGVNSPLSVEGTAKDPDSKIISYSWDFDGDGKFDFSSSTSAETEYTFRNAGSYGIALTVKTGDGKSYTDSARVVVENTGPKAFAGKDIISRKGRKVELTGSGRDEDGAIVKYEWDFNADGTFDWRSADTGFVKHEYDEFSTAVLKVTDSDGATAFDTVKIVICPRGMEPVREGRFCVDTYEYPNQRGKLPAGNMSFGDAQKACRDAGKRLCTANEWEIACKGSGRKNSAYPYGDKYEVENCNTMGNSWASNKISKSGDFNTCKSRYDALDMSGNVAEWTSSGTSDKAYVYGGFWQSSADQSTCDAKVLLEKNKKYFYAGTRCCK